MKQNRPCDFCALVRRQIVIGVFQGPGLFNEYLGALLVKSRSAEGGRAQHLAGIVRLKYCPACGTRIPYKYWIEEAKKACQQ